MAHDLERGNRLEIDWLTGKVRALGRALGIPTPMSDVVYMILKLHRLGICGREFARAATNPSRDAFDPSVDFQPKRIEVDGLCQQRFGTIFQCLPLGLRIAVGRDHDDRNVRSHGPCLGKKLEPAHSRQPNQHASTQVRWRTHVVTL